MTRGVTLTVALFLCSVLSTVNGLIYYFGTRSHQTAYEATVAAMGKNVPIDQEQTAALLYIKTTQEYAFAHLGYAGAIFIGFLIAIMWINRLPADKPNKP
jgi:hypothetical protein